MRGTRSLLALVGMFVTLVLWSWLGAGTSDDGVRPRPGTSADSETASGSAPDDPAGPVTVLAAASLTESFEELATELTQKYPDLEIAFSFGPSSGLVEQALSGARADILATANRPTMDVAVRGGVVDGQAAVVARNTLVIVVPPGNPGDVTGLTDLGREDLRIALCEPQVPCGSASEALFAHHDVQPAADTLATDVKEALAFVTLGEADAALVYRSDAWAAGDAAHMIQVDGAREVTNEYLAALLADAPNRRAATAVMEEITGELGRTVLEDAGFLEP
ncbi:molybdate ABC transporter substrate-binding protein [Actinobacteria bacterium YIM 96077]|uniref:Molybdate ABC transporter substrate-binding protein n=1 Tax=Phytoactinopolyspora halophila TaxID=1981511 RepID=A0A329QJ34_9ACTN|nr:molybdate ABC transporter substrate-binding protein [Phytoactinopolyspora halophila]AYY14344.1 molybdate ABC transporter substrate-binding protein [Actinobacteria bacterium YIM 96077]RAW11931.1 molybdate ABC transporter substrate-binding protein [Phytoactinopolyspora halophila]